MNKKYLVFGLAAVIAIAGIVYFKTGANQQASVAAITSGSVNDGAKGDVGPITINPGDEIAWRLLCRDGNPHVQVISPNGGESYQMGQQIPLKWRSCNAAGVTKMFFGMSTTLTGVNHEVTASSLANDGNEMIDIPGWVVPGNYYKMYVSLGGSPALSDYSNNTFSINQTSTSKVKLSEDVNNPKDRTVMVNYTNTTNDVSMLKFSIKAEGSNVTIRKIAVPATATGVADASKISSYYKLKYNGSIVSSYSLGAGANATPTITFGDATITGSTSINGSNGVTIANNATGSFEILADVRALSAGTGSATNFDEGDKLKVEFPLATLQSPAVTVLDQAGLSLGTTSVNRTGSVNGYNATFRTSGISTVLASSSSVSTISGTTGSVIKQDIRMNVNITANGDDFFIPRLVKTGISATDTVVGDKGFVIAVLNGNSLFDSAATVASTVSVVSGAVVDASGRIKIPAGQTATLQVIASVTAPTGSGRKKLQLNAVGAATTATGMPVSYPTLPASAYQSDFTSPGF